MSWRNYVPEGSIQKWSLQKKTKRKFVHHERPHQILFVEWLKIQGVRGICASANGGSRNIIEAKYLKAMGVSPGYPDITVLYPSGPYHGFFCEMKGLKNGVVTKYQQEWIDYLNSMIYYAVVANGFEEAKKYWLHYTSFDTQKEIGDA